MRVERDEENVIFVVTKFDFIRFDYLFFFFLII